MMQSVGEQLKQTRLARGFTLDQAAQITRIRRNYLEALERGDQESLPSKVQGRGFLRLYAGYLGLPAETLVAEWEGRPLPPPEPFPQETPAPAPEPPPPPPAPSQEIAEEPSEEEEPPQPDLASFDPESSQAVFIKIGQELRRQREILGLSLSDVERHTRLREHHIRALESGRMDDLPSTVQSRGMLSNYAHFLNMDTEGLLLRYADGLQQRRLERLAPQPEPGPFSGKRAAKNGRQPAGAQVRRLITPDLLFIGGLILVLFIFTIWAAARISANRTSQARATLPSVSDVLLYTPSPTPRLTLLESAQVDVTPSAAATDSTLAADSPSGDATSTPAPALPASGSGTPTSTLSIINHDPVQLYIVARKRAFLQVRVDGKIKFSGRLVPAQAYPFSGQTSIDILTGDASGLQIFYNQKDLGTLGNSGDVLSLTFTAQGMQTPTATITVTPSATPRISSTPTPAGSTSPTPSPSVTPLIP